jgi:Spy/CpxP family protein refolding chaperone
MSIKGGCMKWTFAVVVCCALLLCSFVAVRAEDKPAAKPDAKPAKLVHPWSRLSSLSDEQKTQIGDIHKKANEQVSEIRKKEKADIMALLTDEQKAELKRMNEKAAGDRKMKKADAASSAKQDSPEKAGGDAAAPAKE